MELRADVRVPFPVDLVYATYRDRLEELVPHLPNIRSIRVVKREDEGGEVRMVNEWVGGGEFPKVARAFVSDDMLKWTDHAKWIATAKTCEWRTEVHAFSGAVSSAGTNRFVPDGDGTRVEIRGSLRVDATKIPGVPGFLRKTVGEAVEKFLTGRVAENLAEVGRGVARMLGSSPSAPM
jgi:hypothetical protein